MNNESDLKRALEQLACVLPREAGSAVESRLHQTFRAVHRRRRMKWLVAAAAACLALALGWFAGHRDPVASHAQPASDSFVLLPYGQSDLPLEHAVIVRVRLQSTAGPVDADLLVGQDGLARAVRFNR